MARIDSYIKSIERFSASGIVLKSNAHILLKFPAGDRHATQTTPHDALQGMVRDVVPSAMRLGLDTGKAVTFEYALDGARYKIGVQPGGAEWTVTIEAAAAAAAAGGMELESHSHAPQTRTPAAPAAAPAGTARPAPAPAAAAAHDRTIAAPSGSADAAPPAAAVIPAEGRG